MPWLLVYAGAGALGLYTLYYFLFLIITLNFIVFSAQFLPQSIRQTSQWPKMRRHQINSWLGAQLLILLFWSPWLPTFWRQATEPPVPPWRVPWNSLATLVAAISESTSALLVGQSAPAPAHWVWPVIGGLVLLLTSYSYAKNNTRRCSILTVLAYTGIPVLLIFGISVWLTPLYHVRYLVLYAPPLLLLLADGFLAYRQRRPFVILLAFGLLILVNSWSLHALWTAPRFQSDDHRAAVADLAQRWRPGDLILINAGWAYTVLETYWPTELIGPNAALPPPFNPITRITDYTNHSVETTFRDADHPIVIRTGSIDGAATLGWGDPASDFFAISTAETLTALEQWSASANRIWHYRLYDTVNDPDGVIRTWLDTNGRQLLDQPISGRDLGRLQLYELSWSAPTIVDKQPMTIAHPLALESVNIVPATPHAGEYLYLQSNWRYQPQAGVLPADVRFSLRLYNGQKELVAQQDETPLVPVPSWSTMTPVVLPLVLPIPIATPPDTYTLRLLAYDGASGEPILFSISDQIAGATDNHLVTIGQISLAAPPKSPEISGRLARFDYIDLISAAVWSTNAGATQALAIDLLWLPHDNPYRDTYVARWSLVDEAGTVHQTWEEALGGWGYPSGEWPAKIPVRQRVELLIDGQLTPGKYQIAMALFRDSDRQQIAAEIDWWRNRSIYQLGSIVVQ